MLERLISKKPFVVFSSSPVSSSQAPLPPAPSADLFGAGDNCQERELVQKMSFKDLEKEIIRVKGLRTKFCFEQQLKLEKTRNIKDMQRKAQRNQENQRKPKKTKASFCNSNVLRIYHYHSERYNNKFYGIRLDIT